MKLRVRSLESKETHRIEVPNPCTFQQLKQLIANQFSIENPVFLSLNRKDELCGSSQESLQTIGITSGDLIYYSPNPLSQNPNILHAQVEKSLELSDAQMLECNKVDKFDCFRGKSVELVAAQIGGTSKLSNFDGENHDLVDAHKAECCNLGELVGKNDQNLESRVAHVGGSLELGDNNDKNECLVDYEKGDSVETVESIEGNDEMEVDDELICDSKAKFSVPSFLRKVFVKEVGDAANGGNHKLLVIAVHAVLMESGFVAYDPVSGRIVDGFHLADEWPSLSFGISLRYTLPEVASSEVVDTVVVKFSNMGKFVKVYGRLDKKGFEVHQVCLDESHFVPALNLMWKKSDSTDLVEGSDVSQKLYPNREIFEFWKIVKDGLSYPLLIDLSENLGLVPPPCFMRLPTELKFKILESLPAVDVAKVACVCSELRFLSSNNDLWMLKYEEEFGNAAASQRECQWKAKFTSSWVIRRKRKRVCMPYPMRGSPLFRPLFPGRRDPNPFGYPFIFGGDYDAFPAVGIPQRRGPRIFRMDCDL